MLSTEAINILNTIEIIQKIILGLLFVITGLGVISVIVNIIRLAVIRMVFSMIFMVSAMIINIVSKFLTFDLMIYNVNIKTLIPGIILLIMQILITVILLILTFKKKKIVKK